MLIYYIERGKNKQMLFERGTFISGVFRRTMYISTTLQVQQSQIYNFVYEPCTAVHIAMNLYIQIYLHYQVPN